MTYETKVSEWINKYNNNSLNEVLDVRFDLRLQIKPKITEDDKSTCSKINTIVIGDPGENYLGGTNGKYDQNITIKESSKKDIYSIMHELIHSLGGANPTQENPDNHKPTGLMRRYRPSESRELTQDDIKLEQSVIDEIIENGKDY